MSTILGRDCGGWILVGADDRVTANGGRIYPPTEKIVPCGKWLIALAGCLELISAIRRDLDYLARAESAYAMWDLLRWTMDREKIKYDGEKGSESEIILAGPSGLYAMDNLGAPTEIPIPCPMAAGSGANAAEGAYRALWSQYKAEPPYREIPLEIGHVDRLVAVISKSIRIASEIDSQTSAHGSVWSLDKKTGGIQCEERF